MPEITDFELEGPLNDFTIEGGKLVVPSDGPYYIYGQAFFEAGSSGNQRAAITVNGDPISLLQSVIESGTATYGNRFTGILMNLKKDDRIGFKAVFGCKLWMAPMHTFFGAYKISK